jgi:hypothetical protein
MADLDPRLVGSRVERILDLRAGLGRRRRDQLNKGQSVRQRSAILATPNDITAWRRGHEAIHLLRRMSLVAIGNEIGDLLSPIGEIELDPAAVVQMAIKGKRQEIR